MGQSITLTLDGAPSMNSADNRHWRTRNKEKKLWYARVESELMMLRPQISGTPWGKASITITRCTAASRAPDFENLAQGGKFILDGLVRSKVILDDNPDVIRQPVYKWERAKRGDAHVIVEVQQEEG